MKVPAGISPEGSWAGLSTSGMAKRPELNAHHHHHRRPKTHPSRVSLRASFPIHELTVLSNFDDTSNILSMSSNLFGGTADEWISQAEAARIRGVSRQAIADLVKRRRLETLKIGGRLLVRRADIEQFSAQPSGRPSRRHRK